MATKILSLSEQRRELAAIEGMASALAGDVVIATVPGYAKTLIRKYRQTAVGVDGNVSFDLVALNPADLDSVKDAHLRGATIVARIIGAYRSL